MNRAIRLTAILVALTAGLTLNVGTIGLRFCQADEPTCDAQQPKAVESLTNETANGTVAEAEIEQIPAGETTEHPAPEAFTPVTDEARRMAAEVSAIRSRLGLNVFAGTMFEHSAGDDVAPDETFQDTIRSLADRPKTDHSESSQAPTDERVPSIFPNESPRIAATQPPSDAPWTEARPLPLSLVGGTEYATASVDPAANVPPTLAAEPDVPNGVPTNGRSAWQKLYQSATDLDQVAEEFERSQDYDRADAVRLLADRIRGIARRQRDEAATANFDGP